MTEHLKAITDSIKFWGHDKFNNFGFKCNNEKVRSCLVYFTTINRNHRITFETVSSNNFRTW